MPAINIKVERLFRALSDQTRLRIVNLLRDGELCVCDIVSILRVPQPKASRHLAYLRRAGLVVARKDGHWNYYRLAEARNKLHERVLDCLASCPDVLPQLTRDTKSLRRTGCSECAD